MAALVAAVRGPGAPCSTAEECARVSTGLMRDLYEVRRVAEKFRTELGCFRSSLDHAAIGRSLYYVPALPHDRQIF